MNPGNPGPGSNPNGSMDRKGSVRRAREMLEAGRRPEVRGPPPSVRPPPPPPIRTNQPHMTQRPLPNEASQGTIPMADPSTRLFVPKGPPPQRPPRPDLPSPSVYSERSVSDATPSPLHIRRVPSFSQPLGHPPPPRPAVKGPAPPRPARPDDSNHGLYRQSTASSIGSMSIPDFPVPAQPVKPDNQRQFQKQPANLAPPPQLRPGINRPPFVSPIPEETDSPTIHTGSFASSRVIPSSWGSARVESAILDTYLDGVSDEENSPRSTGQERNGTLVRQASLGKRGVAALRTISRPNVDAPPQEPMPNLVPQGAASKEISTGGNDRKYSISSTSTDASRPGLEKAPFMLDLGNGHPLPNRAYPNPSREALENDMGALPKAAPTMSDKRPGARRPPRLDMEAVRDAEKRGSITSLPDLIRRATKLASNLEHGRTASKTNLFHAGGGPRFAGHQPSKSGSIKDLLASFPPPAATPEGGRASWPIFFRRSTLHHIKSTESVPEAAGTGKDKKRPRRRCCGMPLWLFILLCVLAIVIILVAVLVPVFLVANKNSGSDCESSTPCANGGVSVSSGDVCSCVCSNGFTGSQCMDSGDSSCTTTEINGGSSSKNATMGSDLPRLFNSAQSNFGVPLEPVTIMALFNQNNVSCTTENALVAFKDVSTGSSKGRRALPDASELEQPKPPTPTTLKVHTRTLAARAPAGTLNGIIFDTSAPTETVSQMTFSTASQTKPASHPTATSSATSTATGSSSSSSPVSTKVVDFSRVAVLYILEKTGAFRAATYSGEKIQAYLARSYPDSDSKDFQIDLTDSGVKGTYSLDFDGYKITLPNGDVVGGG